MSEKIKPLTVRMEELKEDLGKAVGKSRLPASLLELILAQYLAGVRQVAEEERKRDRMDWEAEQKGEGKDG